MTSIVLLLSKLFYSLLVRIISLFGSMAELLLSFGWRDKACFFFRITFLALTTLSLCSFMSAKSWYSFLTHSCYSFISASRIRGKKMQDRKAVASFKK